MKNALVKFIKNAGMVSFGPECQKFKSNLTKFQGRKYCVFINSGSSANLAIVQALLNLGKTKESDNIGFSAITWSNNVTPLIQLGLKPIHIDVELDTLSISSEKLLRVIKKKVCLLFEIMINYMRTSYRMSL